MTMGFDLQSILDLRRSKEKAAEHALALAAMERRREEDKQEALQRRWQDVRAKIDRERKRAATESPRQAAQAIARENYLSHLQDQTRRLRKVADDHRNGALATTVSAEAEARAALAAAHAEHAALAKMKERACADERRIADRRTEDEASDACAWHRKR